MTDQRPPTTDHRLPWLLPFAVGAALRVLAALIGYGYFASDDYRYALEPAWRYAMSGETAPASAIRSVVFARALGMVMRALHSAGVDDPTWLVRGAYMALGLFSLAAIPAVYRLTEARLGPAAARQASWLMACEALVPRLSTRALIEMAAIPPLVWGLLEARRERRGWLAGLLLGVAAMLRFQVGVVAVAAVGYFAWQARWRLVGHMVIGGLATLLMQGLIDAASHGRFLSTLISYVAFNAEQSSRFGKAPWFTYLVFLVLLTLPLTIWLARPLWRAAVREPLVSLCLGVFIAVHSLVPHKEERFVFSALPLAFVLLGSALTEVGPRSRRVFWGVNAVALLVATLSDGQHNIIDPLAHAGPVARIAVVGGYEVPTLYADGRPVQRFSNADALVEQLRADPPTTPIRVVFSADEPTPTLPTPGLVCEPPRVFTGDLVDQALLRINPQGNGRRSPKVAVDCRPTL